MRKETLQSVSDEFDAVTASLTQMSCFLSHNPLCGLLVRTYMPILNETPSTVGGERCERFEDERNNGLLPSSLLRRQGSPRTEATLLTEMAWLNAVPSSSQKSVLEALCGGESSSQQPE